MSRLLPQSPPPPQRTLTREITLALAPMWKLGVTWPPAEPIADNKVKFFLRVHPNGALEHFESNIVVTTIYYEALCV